MKERIQYLVKMGHTDPRLMCELASLYIKDTTGKDVRVLYPETPGRLFLLIKAHRTACEYFKSFQ